MGFLDRLDSIGFKVFVFLSISLPNKSAINKLYEINKIYNKNLFYDISEFNNEKSKEYEDFVKKTILIYN